MITSLLPAPKFSLPTEKPFATCVFTSMPSMDLSGNVLLPTMRLLSDSAVTLSSSIWLPNFSATSLTGISVWISPVLSLTKLPFIVNLVAPCFCNSACAALAYDCVYLSSFKTSPPPLKSIPLFVIVVLAYK